MKSDYSWINAQPGSIENISVDPDARRLLNQIRQDLGGSYDLIIRDFEYGPDSIPEAALVYMNGLSDETAINPYMSSVFQYEQVSTLENHAERTPLASVALKLLHQIGPVKQIVDMESLYDELLSGMVILVLDGSESAYSANNCEWKGREIAESPNQTSIRGPRESFTETLAINIPLIRRKIKDPRLWMEPMVIGRLSKTEVVLAYVNGLAKPSVIENVRERLQAIDIDGVLESGYLEELIADNRTSLFPTMKNTELPDNVASELMEGRIAIMVDGTPDVLIAPAPFFSFMQSAEDYYQYAFYSTLLRALRLLGLFIALLLPSIYIAITTFHRDMLPFTMLFSLAAQREGVPFPAFVEALLMEVTFEILREAGLRMPRPIGQAVSVVGTLVIGQAAVEAGIVSAAMVIVVSVTAIATFTMPSYSITIPIRVLRFAFMATAASFGLYGIILLFLMLLLHLSSIKTFGEPYMAPLAPLRAKDAEEDFLIRMPRWITYRQPRSSRRGGAARVKIRK